MKAVAYCGPYNVKVENVPDPTIINKRDAIIRVTSTCICGSDLHIYDGFMPFCKPGDLLGHEAMGVVEEVGPEVDRNKLKKGDRVIVPFCMSCGGCFFCKRGLTSCCDNTNVNAAAGELAFGFSPSGLFGYTQLTGGFAGGQAEYLRVPYADVNCQVMPADIPDDKLVFLTDIFPTGYMAAENAGIKPDDTVAVWGCGPVGQFAIRSALMLGAGRVIAIDDEGRVPERIAMAREAGAITIDFREEEVYERLREMTGGIGPDVCIDAVGMEAHGFSVDAVYDKVKTSMMMATDRVHALRQAINCCRKGGVLSIPGVYGGMPDKLPFGALMNKGLTIKTGQTHVHRYVGPLLERIRKGEIDPSFVITHKMGLSEAARGYEIFNKKQEGCIKIVLDPTR